MDKPQPGLRSPADRLREMAWAEVYELLDLQLSPLGLGAIAALAPARGEVIVDIGCGAGQTVLQLARPDSEASLAARRLMAAR